MKLESRETPHCQNKEPTNTTTIGISSLTIGAVLFREGSFTLEFIPPDSIHSKDVRAASSSRIQSTSCGVGERNAVRGESNSILVLHP